VLVVDPREEDLAQTTRALEAAGNKVVALARPEALVPLATAFRPEVLLIAARAPDLLALRVVKQFHQLVRGTVPVIYLLDAPDPELRRLCLCKGHGVDAVSRPLDTVELVAKVASWVKLTESVEKASRTQADLRGPSLRDPLTGVFNRRFLLATIGQEVRRSERYGGGFSVAAASLEGFREFKREFGREMADRLLVYASMVITQAVRESDAVARVGDEEFALLLPMTPAESLSALRLRLSGAFQLARFEADGRVIRPALRVGTASFPDVVGSPMQLLTAAFEDLKRSRGDSARWGGPARLPV
jgi:two-component system cell cycle response regulator